MELDKTMEIGFSDLFLQYFQNISILPTFRHFTGQLCNGSHERFLDFCILFQFVLQI